MEPLALVAPDVFRHLKETTSPEPGVQIWIANLDSLSAREGLELAEALDATERKRAAQFHFARDRQYYVAGRGLLRLLLGASLDKSASDLVFEFGARGKPRLVADGRNERRLCFNVSHAAEHALFALAWDRELGIDLESSGCVATTSEGELNDLAARVLSERELALWRALPDSASRHAAFFRAWARKEAYVKATGEGLSAGLRSINVMLPGESGEVRWSGASDGCLLHDLVVPSGFVASLAICPARCLAQTPLQRSVTPKLVEQR